MALESIRATLKRYNEQIDWDKLSFYPDPFTREQRVKDARTYMDKEGHPHVTPLYYFSNECAVACPYCGNLHFHGWMPGYVVPDCPSPHKSGKNYRIEPLPGAEYDYRAKYCPKGEWIDGK